MTKVDKLTIVGSLCTVENMALHAPLRASKDGTVNISTGISDIDRQLGGVALGIAYSARQTSSIPISVISAIGEDEQIVDLLDQLNVDTNQILRISGVMTPTARSFSDPIGNQIWGYHDQATPHLQDIILAELGISNHLFILAPIHILGFRSIQRQLIDSGSRYIYDPGMMLHALSDEELMEGIHNSEITIVNKHEKEVIESRLGTIQLGEGTLLIETLGHEGVKVWRNGISAKHFETENREIVDATGAGDAFRGTLVSCIYLGIDFEGSIEIATQVAAEAIGHKGVYGYEIPKGIMDRLYIDNNQENELR